MLGEGELAMFPNAFSRGKKNTETEGLNLHRLII
jgi:hypothetical protein